jgi:signal peptidase I
MSAETNEQNTRRVRPWIAALLTIFGWGVGFYYARQTKTAWRMVWLSVLAGVLLGAAIFAFVFLTPAPPDLVFNAGGFSVLDVIGWVLLIVVAIFAWRAASKSEFVEPGSPARLLGYLAVILTPIIVSLLIALPLRYGAFHPFRIPSGAMQPTLQVGDYVIVTKWSYGYSRYSVAPFEGLFPEGRWNGVTPERGDLVVFRPTPEPDRDFVKRLIGLPGDRIQMIGGVLHINGAAVAREALGPTPFEDDYGNTENIDAYQETLPNGVSYTTFDRDPSSVLDNTGVFVVPEGHFFMMGDDRDNSADSRVPYVVGYVPFDNLIGRVDYLKRAGAPIQRIGVD